MDFRGDCERLTGIEPAPRAAAAREDTTERSRVVAGVTAWRVYHENAAHRVDAAVLLSGKSLEAKHRQIHWVDRRTDMSNIQNDTTRFD